MLAFFCNDRLDDFFELPALLAVIRARKSCQRHIARLRQLKTQAGAGLFEKSVRHLHQDAGAVTGVFLAAAGAAVIEVLQYRERLLDDLVRFFTLDIDDEADAAGIMLKARIVETLFFRQSE